jgi:glycosyltransferase involved in cell wall biosynthesis
MLIYIYPKYIERGKTGKGRFMRRLVQAWHNMGVQMTDDAEIRADIAIHVGRVYTKTKVRKNILRVGPACVDTNKPWQKVNKEKAQAVKASDGVIYQSAYSQKVYHALVCRPMLPEAVIFNGATRPDYVDVAYPSNRAHTFLASTRIWLKQKRLKDIVKSFVLAEIPRSELIICGDSRGLSKKYSCLENVKFFGLVDDATLESLYLKARAMIHITYLDACPNSVVEAQLVGCPVICTDQGGTHELVRTGIILEDNPFGYKAIDLNHPPAISHTELANAMRAICDFQHDPDAADDLHIDNIAQKYLDFFREVLGE